MPAGPLPDAPRVRVGLAIYDKARVLLHEFDTPDTGHWWIVPGGGLHYGETLHDGAIREAREELCLDVTPGRVLAVTETQFGLHRPETHCVHILFDVPEWSGAAAIGEDPRVHGIAWHPLSELAELRLYPPVAHILAVNAFGEAPQAPLITPVHAAPGNV